MHLRATVRRIVPFEARLRVRLLRRKLTDARERPGFAKRRSSLAEYVHPWAEYERPWVAYPGQEHWTRGKRHNLRLMIEATEGVVIAPGEVFSAWHICGRPTERRGYLPGAALKNGTLTSDIGGGTCLFSTLVYNLALLSGMEILERHAHSQDTYGTERYFELGRDAAIEYGYLDLRFRNPHPVPLAVRFAIQDATISGAILGPSSVRFRVEIERFEPTVLPPQTRVAVDTTLKAGEVCVISPGLPGLMIQARRRTVFEDGEIHEEQLPTTIHWPLPRVITRGASVDRAD